MGAPTRVSKGAGPLVQLSVARAGCLALLVGRGPLQKQLQSMRWWTSTMYDNKRPTRFCTTIGTMPPRAFPRKWPEDWSHNTRRLDVKGAARRACCAPGSSRSRADTARIASPQSPGEVQGEKHPYMRAPTSDAKLHLCHAMPLSAFCSAAPRPLQLSALRLELRAAVASIKHDGAVSRVIAWPPCGRPMTTTLGAAGSSFGNACARAVATISRTSTHREERNPRACTSIGCVWWNGEQEPNRPAGAEAVPAESFKHVGNCCAPAARGSSAQAQETRTTLLGAGARPAGAHVCMHQQEMLTRMGRLHEAAKMCAFRPATTLLSRCADVACLLMAGLRSNGAAVCQMQICGEALRQCRFVDALQGRRLSSSASPDPQNSAISSFDIDSHVRSTCASATFLDRRSSFTSWQLTHSHEMPNACYDQSCLPLARCICILCLRAAGAMELIAGASH